MIFFLFSLGISLLISFGKEKKEKSHKIAAMKIQGCM